MPAKTVREKLLDIDPWLEPFAPDLERRIAVSEEWLETLDREEGGIENFAKGYERFGFQVDDNLKQITFREWAPGATAMWLTGEFCNWDRTAHQLKQSNAYGTWEIVLPAVNGELAIKHDTKVKLVLQLPGGQLVERMPAWSRRVTQDTKVSPVYDSVFWHPEHAYEFKHPRPVHTSDDDISGDAGDYTHGGIKIYEAHIGISTPEARIGTYAEFTRNVLPHIKRMGYNTIQLMAIMEHAYYGSFGYQVTSFFAASSRYGTPEELMALIDEAHRLGLRVLLDVVHSHASKNVLDGLNMFDGTDYQYFHAGGKGQHSLWDSRLFDYGKHEVLRFLLSNLRFYLDIYKFDGFRFDGVSSMLYHHHGIGTGFSGGYHEYFGPGVDDQALNYMILANVLIKKLNPHYITIAEDVSGMPTLCLPVTTGGIGFDYRLAMAIPDMWIKMLKEQSDDEWDMGRIAFILSNRRYLEPTIAYAESHDQALVGDKTLAFWLMDKLMYTHMSVLAEPDMGVDRGMALHKMIRFVTHALGGEGYLNFEGNEFGHPEWLDFPREGNGESYHYARRQFNLIEDHLLLYQFLANFDAAMNKTESQIGWLRAPQGYISLKNNGDKMLVFERAGVLFIFNFHPSKSFSDYRLGVGEAGPYKVLLTTDSPQFRGQGRIDEQGIYHTTEGDWNNRPHSLQVYIPSRVALALVKV